MLCSMCNPARGQQRAESLPCHQLLLCSRAPQPHLAPGSSGTPALGSNLELPCLQTAQHPEKHPQRGERTTVSTNTRLWSKAAYCKYHYNNTNQQHNLITPWCTFNQDYLILHLCASFPLLSRTGLFHIYFCAVLQCIAWLCFTFLYHVPPLQVL